MLVKKFEADNLEEALKAVKVELGPDAIILKTVTNNGLKGAFKKKRIEITAAISEKNYEGKIKVDKVLNTEQKEAFYQKPSGVISDSISKYNRQDNSGYGNLGLNKVVNTLVKGPSGLSEMTSKTTNMIKNSLDDFLNDSDDTFDIDSQDTHSPVLKKSGVGKYAEPPNQKQSPRPAPEKVSLPPQDLRGSSSAPSANSVSREVYDELKQELKTTQNKVQLLEQKFLELSQNVQFGPKNFNEANGINQLRMTLKTLDVNEAHIIDLIRKASYELSTEDLENPDVIFEFALQKMASSIRTETALITRSEQGVPVITVLISEAASGQSTIAKKISVLKKDVVLVELSQDSHPQPASDFATQVFGIKVERAQNFSEVVGICRRASEEKKSVLIDLKMNNKFSDETKKFVETLKRGFQHVEVLCTISAIHAELYNRKIISRYKEILNGVIISHIDLCMNFGALYNIHMLFNKIPIKFFGTGPIVPDDLEGATAERLMAGLFQF